MSSNEELIRALDRISKALNLQTIERGLEWVAACELGSGESRAEARVQIIDLVMQIAAEQLKRERVGGRVGKGRVAASILGPWRPQSIGRGDTTRRGPCR